MDDPTPTFDAPSRPPQRFRRTRIAVSILFGVLTVALCVLWVRSFWFQDAIHIFNNVRSLSLISEYGLLYLMHFTPLPHNFFLHGSSWGCDYASGRVPDDGIAAFHSFELRRGIGYFNIAIPHWVPILPTAAIAGLSFIGQSKQFSLRALLIATTLVAVVLGFGVWLTR